MVDDEKKMMWMDDEMMMMVVDVLVLKRRLHIQHDLKVMCLRKPQHSVNSGCVFRR